MESYDKVDKQQPTSQGGKKNRRNKKKQHGGEQVSLQGFVKQAEQTKQHNVSGFTVGQGAAQEEQKGQIPTSNGLPSWDSFTFAKT